MVAYSYDCMSSILLSYNTYRLDGCPVDCDVWDIQWFSTDPGTKQMQPCGAELTGEIM